MMTQTELIKSVRKPVIPTRVIRPEKGGGYRRVKTIKDDE